ncbi:MAG: tetratricopeptide repeat protein [Rhodocyclaceae bacterium]
MSLINQMLKDLDARHESDVRGRLHREVRALPAAGENRGLRLTIVVLLVLSVAAGAWWAGERYLAGNLSGVTERVTAATSPPVPSSPAPIPSSSVAAVEPATAGPASAEVAAAPIMLPSSPQDSALPDVVALDAASGLKLSASLDKLPESAPATAKPSVPVLASSTKKTEPAAGPVAGAAPRATPSAVLAPLPSPAKTLSPGVVDKTPVAKTVRERAEADYRRAVALVNGARVQEATDLLLDVLHQDGGHVASRQLLVRLLIEQRRNDEAMAFLAEGLATQPGQVAWAMTLARLQVDRGDLAAAARTLRGSQSFAAGNADYLGFAGHVQHRLGQPKEAIDFYQAAVRIAAADGRWWLGLGLALEADHRAADAREAFLRARASGSLNADLLAIVDQKLR